MTSVIEYIVMELMEAAGNVASSQKRKRIKAADILTAARSDGEIWTALGKGVSIIGDRLQDVSSMITSDRKTPADEGGNDGDDGDDDDDVEEVEEVEEEE